MQVRFGTKVGNITQTYTGESDPTCHIDQCRILWSLVPETKWTHVFIHTLDTILKKWYLEMEMCREATS
jgi:hypothetical protein